MRFAKMMTRIGRSSVRVVKAMKRTNARMCMGELWARDGEKETTAYC